MQVFDWQKFKGGWFVGAFEPTILPTENVEVAVKRYTSGSYDATHYHKEADEVTMIIEGTVRMNGQTYLPNAVIWIAKNEATDFLAVTDAVTCVVKVPFVKGDKYIV